LNQAFTPTKKNVERAKGIIANYDEAETAGRFDIGR
jgi:citrate lyase beta subunit|tara:strand:- start:17 stop:124 length:108 start_codon:yes stop_codon:yes gene_type:complete